MYIYLHTHTHTHTHTHIYIYIYHLQKELKDFGLEMLRHFGLYKRIKC